MNKDSILDTVKKSLGLDPEYDAFDPEIIMHINTVFPTLEQLGIGPIGGYAIEGRDNNWDEYLSGDKRLVNVKTYISLRVRLLFDPPTSSHAVSAIQEQIKEFEWRINLTHEESTLTIPLF